LQNGPVLKPDFLFLNQIIMKLIIPNNIFATLFVLSLGENKRLEIEVKEASLITNELKSDETAIGLIPSLDLINNNHLFVSGRMGVGFEGLLSNAYVHYSSGNDEIDSVLLKGDISTNEVILSKIIFKEIYHIQPEFSIDMSEHLVDQNSYLVVGSENWLNGNYQKGTSFSEQVSELIEYPYINFIFASQSESVIKKFNSKYEHVTADILTKLEENLIKIGLSTEVNEFIKDSINSTYFNFLESENQALSELLKLAYYHQIYDDIFDVKFVQ